MVDPPVKWFRSSRCADGACVEMAMLGDDGVGLRDSKRPDQPFLRLDRAQWSAFVNGIKAGDFASL